ASTTTPITFTVPLTVATGPHRLRVMYQYNKSGTAIDPCVGVMHGETEDYMVEILPVSTCTGIPVAGTAFGPSGVCANKSFTLSDTAFSFGVGLIYQWEESPAGAGIWDTIPGANSPTYTVAAGINQPMDYRFSVLCTNGGGSD